MRSGKIIRRAPKPGEPVTIYFPPGDHAGSTTDNVQGWIFIDPAATNVTIDGKVYNPEGTTPNEGYGLRRGPVTGPTSGCTPANYTAIERFAPHPGADIADVTHDYEPELDEDGFYSPILSPCIHCRQNFADGNHG